MLAAQLLARRPASARTLCAMSPAMRSCRLLSASSEAESQEGPSNGVLMAAAEGLRVVDLHRPQTLNALDPAMVSTIGPLLKDWQQEGSDVKLIAFRGSGPAGQSFCAGTNLRFLHDCAVAGEGDQSLGGSGVSVRFIDVFMRDLYGLVHALSKDAPPSVAFADGLTIGAGAGLALHSTIRVATENTLVAMPEMGLGQFPMPGASYELPRLSGLATAAGGGVGMYMALAGPRLGGRDAVAAGLMTHFIRSSRVEHLEGILAELARQALVNGSASADLSVVDTATRSLDAVDTAGLVPPAVVDQGGKMVEKPADDAAAKEIEESFLLRCGAEIEACFGSSTTGYKSSVAEITALVNEEATRQRAQVLASAKLGVDPASQWEDPAAQWAVRAARELALSSPTAMAVTLELMKRGADSKRTREECLQEEFHVARRMARHPDFVAGARAVITRSREGLEWAPAPVEGSGELEEMFEDLPEEGSVNGNAGLKI